MQRSTTNGKPFLEVYESQFEVKVQMLLFGEIGVELVQVPLFRDNPIKINKRMETMSSKSNKDMEIRYTWLLHYAHSKWIMQPFNIASASNLADIMTKVLPLC